VLGLFERLAATPEVSVVTLSHEPGVGFAADGYARAARRPGVVCVTYGAGGHNVVNAVAGAYAERVPLLVISGSPGVAEAAAADVHHQVKHIEGQMAVFRQITCAWRRIDGADTAAKEIHEAVLAMLRESRPAYIEIPRDCIDTPIPVPEHVRAWDGTVPRAPSDPDRLREAVDEAAARVRAARTPLVLMGVGIFRAHAEAAARRLAEQLGAPVATTLLGKGAFPMTHPLHLGVSVGGASVAPVAARIGAADCVLCLGTQLTDINLGPDLAKISRDVAVWAKLETCDVGYHSYAKVQLLDFVEELSKRKNLRFHDEDVVYADHLGTDVDADADVLAAADTGTSTPLSSTSASEVLAADARVAVRDVLLEINAFLAAQGGGFNVVAESGDALFGGVDLRVPEPGLYIAQARA
jgi:indolepyruvate decarboxylase